MTIEDFIKLIDAEDQSYDFYKKTILEFLNSNDTINVFPFLLRLASQRQNEALMDALTSVAGTNNIFYEISNKAENQVYEEVIDLIGEALEQHWHGAHEDFVSELEHFPHVKTVDLLRTIIETEPPIAANVDDADSLSRKAIWALGKMASPLEKRPVDPDVRSAAIITLRQLMDHSDRIVVERVRQQLHRITHGELS
ncbi:hypothetical protein [Agrobacterium vitis]|uniref:hypothetical protein n=1 Tax=Agrobacterium vitis TaxID=373 RepID=UPI001573B64E|nr:hypothetical protein [Agrobacterium vitis]NSZ16352.1 hypothetical protein [Agrobacterium vitis]QZO05107.1 hypothetical protein K4831_06155 [Agrobacterium vitis]UJL87255.1 hypothetical protein AVF2S5_04495 [Agrobacterium vitis]